MTRRVAVPAFVLAIMVALSPLRLRSGEPSPEPIRLDARKALADVDLSDTTLEKAFDRLRTLTGVNLVVRWPAMEAAGVRRDAPVRMRLWDVHPDAALTMLLRYEESGHPAAPLAWQEEDGVVTVSTADDLPGSTKVHDVRDLLGAMTDRPNRVVDGTGPGAEAALRAEVEDELATLIRDTVLPDSWRDNGGTIGSIRFIAGRLVVLQSFEGHQQVQRFLQELRQEFVEKDKQPATAPAAANPVITSPSALTPSSPRPAGG